MTDEERVDESRNGVAKRENEEAKEENEVKEATCFGHRTRYVILALGTLCLTSILSNILIFDVTVICMTKRREMPGPWKDEIASGVANFTVPLDLLSASPEFEWPATIKNILLSAIAVGPLVIVPMTVWLLEKMGARKLFALTGAFSALATALSPIALKSGFIPFLISRLAQGAGLAACFPIVGKLAVGWATVKHTTFFAAIGTGFVQFAPMFTMPVGGQLCSSSIGWEAVYYIHAAITVYVFTLWVIFYHDTPHTHLWIAKAEVAIITKGKPIIPVKKKPPYWKIFATPSVWAIALTSVANYFAMQMYVVFMPSYFHNVLHYDIKHAGLLAALPVFSMFVIKLIAASISDRCHFSTETNKVRLFNSIASLGSGIPLIVLAFVPKADYLLSIGLLVISAGLLGCNSSGVFKSVSAVAREHSHVTIGIIQVMMCLSLAIWPFALSALVQPTNDWSFVFGTVAVLLIVSNLFFAYFGKGSAAHWTHAASQAATAPSTAPSTKIHPVNGAERAEAGMIAC